MEINKQKPWYWICFGTTKDSCGFNLMHQYNTLKGGDF